MERDGAFRGVNGNQTGTNREPLVPESSGSRSKVSGSRSDVSGSRSKGAGSRLGAPGSPSGPRSGALGDPVVQHLSSCCGALFSRGFSLTVHRDKLYVRTLGTKVPLYLPLHAHWEEVHERAQLLRDHLEQHGSYVRHLWESQTSWVGAVANTSQGSLQEMAYQLWWKRKRAEGCSQASFEKHYGSYIRRLDERQPFSDSSLMGLIESTDPQGSTRKRLVSFLRELAESLGAGWNAPLLDPLQMRGRRVNHREQPFFSDDEIERILHGVAQRPHRGWQKVLTLMAIYGLRPWEAWIAEPSSTHRNCLWIPIGKKNSKGTNPPRTVPPYHPEWVERFQLQRLVEEAPPQLNSLSIAGARTTQQLHRYGFCSPGDGQTSYGFRHAYARRLHSPLHRVTDTHGALFMGHTVAAHNKAYRQWIDGQADPLESLSLA